MTVILPTPKAKHLKFWANLGGRAAVVSSWGRISLRDLINILIPRRIGVNSSVIDDTIIFLNPSSQLEQMVKNTLAF